MNQDSKYGSKMNVSLDITDKMKQIVWDMLRSGAELRMIIQATGLGEDEIIKLKSQI